MQEIISIHDKGNGQFDIRSALTGPASTIRVLRRVIEAIEQAAVEQETGAAPVVAEASDADKVRLALADRWAKQRESGMGGPR